MYLNSYCHDLMGKAAKDHGNHFTTGHSSHCLHPRCLLTSTLDISKPFKSSTLLRGLTNDMDANLVSQPISQIPEKLLQLVLLLQVMMPISSGRCNQPPPLETQACSSYSEVSHQTRDHLVPSGCGSFEKTKN